MKASTLRIGAINWDCSLPSSTYFGHYATQSLGDIQFRDRTPYYAIDLGGGRIDYPARGLAEFETEMRYAIAAGIDYFAYCWYDRMPHPDHKVDGAAAEVDDKVCELAWARTMHLQSPLRDQLGLCAILISCHPYFDGELRDLARTMKEDCYEKIGGRPLVYLFPGPWLELLERLKAFCQTEGTPEPYAVLMTTRPPEQNAPLQALCNYACCAEKKTYEELFGANLDQNTCRASGTFAVVPHFSLGWDPSPRVKRPVPWTSYSQGPYHPKATASQLLEAARGLKLWMKNHQDACSANTILTFAWNEFEEGAWLCPTLAPDGSPDTSRIETFSQIASIWKE